MKKIIKYLTYFVILLLLTLVIFGKINSSKIKTGNLKFSKDWQGQFTEINGEKIRYIQKGKGENILLIHGTPGSIEDWQPIIDSLSINYKVTAFDRLGNGFSTANNYSYTVNENIDLINQLITKLKLDSIVVVGHSYGGSIAAQMATQKNDKIKSYVIIAAPLYTIESNLNYKLISTAYIGKGIASFASNTLASKMVEDGLNATFKGNTNLLTNDFIKTRKQIWTQSKVLFTTSNERTNYNKNTKNYKTINTKISFLVGENDYHLIIKDFNRIKSEVKNGAFIFLKNTAHFIQFEQTNKLLKVIKSHIHSKKNTINE